MIVPRPAGNRRSRWRPRHGWWRWRAGRRRTSAIPTNCGQRDFWPATLASTDRQRDTQASPIWAQGTVCKIFGQERGEATFAREHETSCHGTVSLLAGGAGQVCKVLGEDEWPAWSISTATPSFKRWILNLWRRCSPAAGARVSGTSSPRLENGRPA
jgi:hypothetical protein